MLSKTCCDIVINLDMHAATEGRVICVECLFRVGKSLGTSSLINPTLPSTFTVVANQYNNIYEYMANNLTIQKVVLCVLYMCLYITFLKINKDLHYSI